MSIALARSYTVSKLPQQKRGYSAYDKIKANDKWVQYSLDIIELTKTLQNAVFNDKFVISKAIKIAEGKRDYMYKHPNFELSEATRNLKLARRLLKI